MARSYFSRIAAPARLKTLAPPRPIATLWKAARFERMAKATSLSDTNPDRLVWKRSDGVEFLSPPLFTDPGREATDLPGKGREPALGFRSKPTVDVRRKDTAVPLVNAVTDPRAVAPEKVRDLIEPLSTISRGEIETRDFRAELGPEVEVRREALPPAVSSGARQERRERPTTEGRGQARGESRNTLHIGKIEVQVIPPKLPVRQASPSQPRSRLARGYTLWTNQQ